MGGQIIGSESKLKKWINRALPGLPGHEDLINILPVDSFMAEDNAREHTSGDL